MKITWQQRLQNIKNLHARGQKLLKPDIDFLIQLAEYGGKQAQDNNFIHDLLTNLDPKNGSVH